MKILAYLLPIGFVAVIIAILIVFTIKVDEVLVHFSRDLSCLAQDVPELGCLQSNAR